MSTPFKHLEQPRSSRSVKSLEQGATKQVRPVNVVQEASSEPSTYVVCTNRLAQFQCCAPYTMGPDFPA